MGEGLLSPSDSSLGLTAGGNSREQSGTVGIRLLGIRGSSRAHSMSFPLCIRQRHSWESHAGV